MTMRSARRSALAALATPCLLVALFALPTACTPSSSSAPSSPDGSIDGRAPSPFCPAVSQLAVCTPAPVTDCSNASLGCGLDALPTGLACLPTAQCAMAIDPCPDWQMHLGSERTDGYVCTCIGGRWSCDDCFEGESLCAEQPDGAASDAPTNDGPLEAANSVDAAPSDAGDAAPDGAASTDATTNDADAGSVDADAAPGDATPDDAEASLSSD
jgi:hypothetical protein